MSEPGEKEFAVSDVEYNLVTTLSNLLQAEDVLEGYAADADKAGEHEVSRLFTDLRRSNKQAARGLRTALAKQLQNNS